MIILGLHFGHDASVAVVRDGEILSYVLRERNVRVKHAITLDMNSILKALDHAGIGASEIDYCAVTSTQEIEIIVDRPDLMSFKFSTINGHPWPCTFRDILDRDRISIETRLKSSLLDLVYDKKDKDLWLHTLYASLFPEYRSHRKEDFSFTGWIDDYISVDVWGKNNRLRDISGLNIAPLLNRDTLRHGFHYPVTLFLEGREIPCSFIHHHMGHAAACYYLSGFREAALFSHDGYSNGLSYHSGMYYYARDNRIYPVAPHHLTIGTLYDQVGVFLELGAVGPAGKLMGLAAYGKPRFFDRHFVGNYFDYKERFDHSPGKAWIIHCLQSAEKMGYDMRFLAKPENATAPINVDIAASTQKLFEEVRFLAVQVLHDLLINNGINTPNLCLTGGTALNCPSNTQIYNEGPFKNVFVEPPCDDGGLSIGVALALYHNLLDQPLLRKETPYPSPYLGAPYDEEEIIQTLDLFKDRIFYTRCQNPGLDAASDIIKNRVIGWFEGGSEAGPRALGHRSILADARVKENWSRVNRIKGREFWRPFAPAVLQSEIGQWFEGLPQASPYMLFNAQVKNPGVPAITHVDNTARIQTVDESNGEYYNLLKEFFRLTGVPVVLNTSFNGPGEPIVETPKEALTFFTESALETLYISGFRITKN